MSEEDLNRDQDLFFMKKALFLAQKAAENEEVPIGALVCRPFFECEKGQKEWLKAGSRRGCDPRSWKVVSEAFNQVESSLSSLAHAEILAIQKASQVLGTWRLTDCVLYVTLEPCIMCAGAIAMSRLKRVVYGANKDCKGGAGSSLYKVLQDPRLNHHPEVREGVLAEKCSKILRDFFQNKRRDKKTLFL